MSESMESRMGAVEANISNLSKTQEAIFSYMKEGREQREKMIEGFATLTQQAQRSLEYQQICDKERQDHSFRLTSLETSRTRQYGIVTGISAVITTLGAGLAWIAEHSGK